MESLYLLIPIAIVLIFVAVVIFFWAVKSGQYDDLDTEGRRILFDDPLPPVTPTLVVTPKPSEKKASTSKTEAETSND